MMFHSRAIAVCITQLIAVSIVCTPGLGQVMEEHSPWYPTAAPFEGADSQRTQLFQGHQSLGRRTKFEIQESWETYPAPYSVVTREREELFVFGGEAGMSGAYVALVDSETLAEQWRIKIFDHEIDGQPVDWGEAWSYPGGIGVHANGFVYAVASSRFVRIDPATGRSVSVALPELAPANSGTGAAYNGFVLLDDGTIVAKGMERGPCDQDGTAALYCVRDNRLPSTLVLLDPLTLEIMDAVATSEPIIGRIAVATHAGRQFVYCPGITTFVRYEVTAAGLQLDPEWWLHYRTRPRVQPASGAGVMGNWAVFATNILPGSEPMRLWVVDVRDSRRAFSLEPFPDTSLGLSFGPKKPALDYENNRILIHDFFARELAAVELRSVGLNVAWRKPLTSLYFGTLVGGAADRELILPGLSGRGHRVTWIDNGTGRTIARTQAIPDRMACNYVAPGFEGRFYHLTAEGLLYSIWPLLK